jgi:hypothetical protein
MEIEGDFISSIRYKIFIEGEAINRSVIEGKIVQNISIS